MYAEPALIAHHPIACGGNLSEHQIRCCNPHVLPLNPFSSHPALHAAMHFQFILIYSVAFFSSFGFKYLIVQANVVARTLKCKPNKPQTPTIQHHCSDFQVELLSVRLSAQKSRGRFVNEHSFVRCIK